MPNVLDLRRSSHDRVVSGVAAGIAARTALDPLLVRIAFVVLGLFGGAGVLIYAGFHLLLPDDTGAMAERSTFRALVLGAVAFAVSGVIRAFGFVPFSGVTLPVAVAILGGAVLWREIRGDADDDRPPVGEVLRRLVGDDGATGGRRRIRSVRVLVGGSLVVVASVAFFAANGSISAVGPALGSMAILLLGVALLAAPWLWRLASELNDERTARALSEERAGMAAHLHDSVLQTLTLIQRHPERADEVARLARRQERELRDWLHDPDRPLGGTFAAVIRKAADQVEDDYGVNVELVVVGDLQLDDEVNAAVAAASEAMRNGAKHAGVGELSVYAEVTGTEIEVFVRDRGAGFDPEAVDDDRHGIADSIVGRMERVGGSAVVRSAVGEGTEVRLRLPREEHEA
ncbi:MAG: PspC domain-containing protein [Actinomycetota bacterium]